MDGTAKVIVLGMLAAMLAGCATLETLAPALAPPPPASLPPGAPLEAQLRQRLVGRWDGRVDLTFSDATLMIDGVRLERGVWAVDAAYGTTNLFLSAVPATLELRDRKSTRLNSSHGYISYAVFCLKKKKQ